MKEGFCYTVFSNVYCRSYDYVVIKKTKVENYLLIWCLDKR